MKSGRVVFVKLITCTIWYSVKQEEERKNVMMEAILNFNTDVQKIKVLPWEIDNLPTPVTMTIQKVTNTQEINYIW